MGWVLLLHDMDGLQVWNVRFLKLVMCVSKNDWKASETPCSAWAVTTRSTNSWPPTQKMHPDRCNCAGGYPHGQLSADRLIRTKPLQDLSRTRWPGGPRAAGQPDEKLSEWYVYYTRWLLGYPAPTWRSAADTQATSLLFKTCFGNGVSSLGFDFICGTPWPYPCMTNWENGNGARLAFVLRRLSEIFRILMLLGRMRVVLI